MTVELRTTPAMLVGLCDDAAIFPPGNLPLAQAVPAHLVHRAARHAQLVGPLVVSAASLPELAVLAADLAPSSFDLAVTVPSPMAVGGALAAVGGIRAARLTTLEVAVPADLPADAVVPMLALAVGDRVEVFVEAPRDERRDDLLARLADSPYLAKFRTGGVRAGLYPDGAELAGAVLAAVRAGVPFKATAGLHHAVRNTDPQTGFEQHGFLNVLVATDAALSGAQLPELVDLLAERDGARLADRVRNLAPRVRAAFRSFGTCSIAEPVTELVALGLLDPIYTEDLS